MKIVLAFIFGLFCVAFAARADDLAGKVLGPDGNPIAHATVYCFRLPNPTPGKHDAPTTRSDDTGEFKFPQVTGACQLVASANGLGMGMLQHAAGDGAADVHLTHGTNLTVQFITEDKKPATRVTIAIQSFAYSEPGGGPVVSFRIPRGYHSPWTATTDENGQCTFNGLPQGGHVSFTMTDARFASLTSQDQVKLAWADQTQADPITLMPGATISGRATYDPGGAPARGVIVDACIDGAVIQSATSAADGGFSLRQLHTGKYTVALHPNQNLEKSWTAVAVENLDIAPGTAKTGVNLPLIPGVVLHGSVVSSDDHRPFAGVRVSLSGPAHPHSAASGEVVVTDAAGHFFARVPPGEQLVSIASDKPAAGFARPSPDHQSVTIADGAIGSVDFQLPRPTTVVISPKIVPPAPPPPAPPVPAPVLVTAQPSPTPAGYDPADAVTWQWWLYSAMLIVAGSAISIFISAVNAIRRVRKT